MTTTMVAVTRIFGEVDLGYFCHYSIGESLIILPILNWGILSFFAWVEWPAWSNAIVAFLPALFWNTIGPPGCSPE